MAGIYYNEFNKESAAMLQQFMDDGLIEHGDIDTRPIQEVQPDEIRNYTQCHFFAGIAGWTFALQLAGWPAKRPVWTGSCPCQPFSSAGRQKGKADDRHLWPVWQRLIAECRPATVFGEQVASAVTHGWLDDVYEGLEGEGYAVGSAVLPASAVGAPHKRDRLWFVAHAAINDDRGNTREFSKTHEQQTKKRQRAECNAEPGGPSTMGNTEHNGSPAAAQQGSDGKAVQHDAQGADSAREFEGTSDSCNVANASKQGLQGHRGFEQRGGKEGREAEERHTWQGGVWIDCPDGKQRLVEPSIPLLVNGFQHRKPILHALGNAIVPPLAQKFIESTKGVVW